MPSKDPEARKAQMKAWRQSPEGKAWVKAYNQRPDVKAKTSVRKRRKYSGVTPEQVEEARTKQEGKCAICQVFMQPGHQFTDSECADHDHQTGRLRGLLCMICNRVLGMYEHYQRPAGLRVPQYEAYLT